MAGYPCCCVQDLVPCSFCIGGNARRRYRLSIPLLNNNPVFSQCNPHTCDSSGLEGDYEVVFAPNQYHSYCDWIYFLPTPVAVCVDPQTPITYEVEYVWLGISASVQVALGRGTVIADDYLARWTASYGVGTVPCDQVITCDADPPDGVFGEICMPLTETSQAIVTPL